MISVPVLTPRLSSLWLGLVTPVYARVGRKLIEGVRNPTVVQDGLALKTFDIRPKGLSEAIHRALFNEDRQFAETRWSDALSSTGSSPNGDEKRWGNRIVDSRSIELDVSPAKAFAPIQQIGGQAGWYYGNLLWKIRGFLDILVGGAGMRRGRRHPIELHVGDTVDFWRVEFFEPQRVLRLAAEMRLPGRAWLEFEVSPCEKGTSIRQTAIFDPLGLGGLFYWYGLYPIHWFVFRGMLKRIAQRAVDLATVENPDDSRMGEDQY